MPYFMRKEEGQFCVYQGTKQKPEKRMKCYDEVKDAQEYLGALQARVHDGVPKKNIEKAEWSAAMRNNLPDSSFLYIEPGGKKDDEGKTVPRSLRHLPYKNAEGKVDLPHLRNAISRLGQPKTGTGDGWLSEDLRKRLLSKARKILSRHGGGDDKKKDISLEQELGSISDAFYSKFSTQNYAVPQSAATFYIREIYEDYLVVRAGEKYYKVSYTKSADDVSFASSDEWQQVEMEWSPVSKLVSYKDASGQWRWAAISSTAVEDREEEIVSTKAYDDAIETARKEGFGELDLVHVNGTDVGDCDQMIRLGDVLFESGPWYDTPMATRARLSVGDDPDYWGVSLKFIYDPAQFDGTTYTGGIRILKRTILPREMAASYGTAISVTGGNMDKEKAVALEQLGLDQETIQVLAEKEKSIEELENVVEKDEEDEEGITEKIEKEDRSLKDRLLELLGLGNAKAPQEPAAEEDTEVKRAPELIAPQIELSEDVLKAVTDEIETNMVEVVKDILAVTVKEAVVQLAKSFDEKWKAVDARVSQLGQPIEEQVAEKLSQLPPVVKVVRSGPSSIPAPGEKVQIKTDEPVEKTYKQEMIASIVRSVESAVGELVDRFEV